MPNSWHQIRAEQYDVFFIPLENELKVDGSGKGCWVILDVALSQEKGNIKYKECAVKSITQSDQGGDQDQKVSMWVLALCHCHCFDWPENVNLCIELISCSKYSIRGLEIPDISQKQFL